jgi:hypothetical protein
MNHVRDGSEGFPTHRTGGWGQQFILYAPAIVSEIDVRLFKQYWGGQGGVPVAGILTGYLYGDNGPFGSIDSYADGLIATSTNTVDADNIGQAETTFEFDFGDVILGAGVYYFCIKQTGVDGDGGVYFARITWGASTVLGSICLWDEEGNRWQPWSWD